MTNETSRSTRVEQHCLQVQLDYYGYSSNYRPLQRSLIPFSMGIKQSRTAREISLERGRVGGTMARGKAVAILHDEEMKHLVEQLEK